MSLLKKAFQAVLAFGFAASLSAAPQQQGTTARPASDIVSDNLDRVAAAAEQILEVLNKDSGLMVEFKILLAGDAGNSGQILEESDLSDGAINERLRQDLRTRVRAIRRPCVARCLEVSLRYVLPDLLLRKSLPNQTLQLRVLPLQHSSSV